MGPCIVQCKMMLFCVKTIMIDSHNFELAHLKNEEEKQIWPLGSLINILNQVNIGVTCAGVAARARLV